MYNFKNNKVTKKEKKRDILYCANVADAIKDNMQFPSFKMQRDSKFEIISAVSKSRFNMDISLAPSEKEREYNFFKGITDGMENIKIIKNCNIENIIDKYKIIIIDYPHSAVTPYAMISNAKVIFYLKDKTTINNWALLDDLDVKVVYNKLELEKFLDSFKFNIYPWNHTRALTKGIYGKPIEAISDTIRELIK